MGADPANLPPLIRKMLSGDFYPHPTVDTIELIQTHISYLLLTGRYVYKVKKALNLGFLDFTTVERRRHFCQEEVRLNQRGAPGIYLDSLPITAKGNDYRLGGTGIAVDYAVKMRQFPQDGLLDKLLACGQLGDELIGMLARTLAEYHQGAATSEDIVRFGRAQLVQRVIDDNYSVTERFIGGPQTADQYRKTRGFTDGFFGDYGPVLEERVRCGHIRECHGDLHLGNICWWEGSVLLFDCIEFNESFRYIDVMQDAAFTMMDLDAHGRADLANGFINSYAERTGDWEGLRVLPLYLCRHACVRAKVNSLLSEEPEVPPPARESALAAAAGYYRLAANYAEPHSGELILVCGVSGSGKTTVARALSRQRGAIQIRSDAVRKHLAGVPLENRGTDELYTAEMTQRTYSRLVDLGMILAQSGFTVILDATYSHHDLRMQAIRRAQAARIPVQILHCVAPTDVLRNRLAGRKGDISDATPELLTDQQDLFQPFEEERRYVTVIDTSRPVEFEQLIMPVPRQATTI